MAGLAVTYGLNLNARLSRWILSFCKLENKIISIERINQYSEIPSEAPPVIENCRPPAAWPEMGTIELIDLKVCCCLLECCYYTIVSLLSYVICDTINASNLVPLFLPVPKEHSSLLHFLGRRDICVLVAKNKLFEFFLLTLVLTGAL